jgi:hypothetical protein
MGRPINKKYFGNRNVPAIGGEGVSGVTVAGTNNNYSAFPTVAFAAPQLPEGVTAAGTARMGVISATVATAGTGYSTDDVLTLVGGTGTAATITVNSVDTGGEVLTFTVTTAGNYSALANLVDLAVTGGSGTGAEFTVTALTINSIVISQSGAGYTSAPTVTTTPSGNATLTATLSSVKENAITVTGRVVAGSTVALDVIKQTGSRRYLVTDGTNVGVVTLVDSAVSAAGQVNIVATDSAGGTYFVKKLTARRAVLTRDSGTEFADGQSVAWTLGDAVLNVSVKVANA